MSWPKQEGCLLCSVELMQSPTILWFLGKAGSLSCHTILRWEQYSKVWNMLHVEPEETHLSLTLEGMSQHALTRRLQKF